MVLQLVIEGGGRLDFEVKKILNAGFTSRDQSQAQKHIDKLKREGVWVPKLIPAFFPKTSNRITTGDRIEVLSNTTSGEVEFVLLFEEGDIYVAVGSDHVDRKLEQHNILAAKQVCVNVISTKVWHYEEVKDHWDDLILRSWVERNGQRQLYQEAKLGTFMGVEELIEKVKSQVSDLSGMVFYAGTMPVIGGEICFSRRFEGGLVDKKQRRTLSCAYSVEPITWFKGEMQTG